MAETVIGTDAVVVYGLSTDIKTAKPVGSLFIEEDTGLEFSMGSSGWFQRKLLDTDSVGNVSSRVIVDGSLFGTVISQTVTALGATRQRLTFDPPIKGMAIEIVPGAISPDEDEAALFCVDAPTTAVADAWLDESNAAPRLTIKPDDGVQNIYFNGATVSTVDLIAKGTTPDLDVTVSGVS